VVRDLDHRAGHLDTGRARADHDEGHPGFAQRLVGATLGVLERADDARALIEDGVPVAPLPFVPGRKTN
jgi:hypothetical protein